jgi:hypothetical protein
VNLDTLKEKKELVSPVLLVISLLSIGLILVRVTGFFVASAKAENTVKDAIKHSKPDSKNVAAQLDKSKKLADALKKDNLFSPAAPKQNPIKAVMGILGDEAWINGKWYKAGDKVADAKILAVNATSVETEWDGKKTTFSPIDGGASSGPGGPSRGGRPSARRGSSSSGAGRPGMVVTQGSKPEGGGGGPPGMEGMTRERMMSMSEEERSKFREQMRDRYEGMSESERETFRGHMRERFGGRPGGGGGPGRGGRPGGGDIRARGGDGGGRGGRR